MSDANPNLAIRIVPLPVGWTPIVCPIACAQAVIQNTDPINAANLRTDANDATTQRVIAASAEVTLRASQIAWGPGTILCFASAASSVTVTYTR